MLNELSRKNQIDVSNLHPNDELRSEALSETKADASVSKRGVVHFSNANDPKTIEYLRSIGYDI